MLNKIWVLLGIFYLSLIPVGFFYCKKSQFQPLLTKIILFNAIALAVFFSKNAYVEDHYPLQNLTQDPQQHINTTTKGQATFAQQINKFLPENATGCIYRSGDMYTSYLIQEIYPRVFKPIIRGTEITDCQYLISLDQPDPSQPPYPVLQYQTHYVYKIQ